MCYVQRTNRGRQLCGLRRVPREGSELRNQTASRANRGWAMPLLSAAIGGGIATELPGLLESECGEATDRNGQPRVAAGRRGAAPVGKTSCATAEVNRAGVA